MKKFVMVLVIVLFSSVGFSQIQDIEQLQLDLEKLVQMKSMLSSMYNGYATIANGYNQVTGLAKGNFDLHKNYLDQLIQVAVPVKNYPLVQSVLDMQMAITNESQTAYLVYIKSGVFKTDELLTIKTKFDLLKSSVAKQMVHLQAVLTPGTLRMSDQERISAIDRIDKDVGDALGTERALVKEQNAVAVARGQRKKDVDAMRALYGLKN